MAQDTTCGIVWDEPIVLSDTAFNAYSPEIALSGDDTVHVVWMNGSLTIRLPYMRSTNGGMSFEPRRELLTDSVKFLGRANRPSIVANGSKVYVFFKGATFQGTYTPVRMIKSVDGGSGWASPVDISPDSTGPPPQSPAVHGDTLAIVYEPLRQPLHRILRSTNSGTTWTKTNDELPDFSRIVLTGTTQYGASLVRPAQLHLVANALVNYGEVLYQRSTNLGTTWEDSTLISVVDGFGSDVPYIAAEESLVVAIWRDSKYGCLGLVGCSIASRTGRITADSVIWNEEEILTDAPRGYPGGISIHGGRKAVVWEDELISFQKVHTVVKLSGRGTPEQWCPTIDITPTYDRAIISPTIAISQKAVHVVWEQDGGIGTRFRIYYRRGRFVTTSIAGEKIAPREFTLHQNYPNPFNPRTTITFSLPTMALVTIRVYDVFGREVSVVLRDERKEPGMHQVQWNAEGFASGVYFYKLDVRSRDGAEFTESRKALLLK